MALVLGVMAFCIPVHVHHHRPETQQGYHLGRGHIGECGDYDLIARFQAEGHQGYLQGISTVAAGNNVPCTRVLRQSRCESSYHRTVDESRAVNDLRYGCVDLRLYLHILTVKVYHLYLLLHITHVTNRKDEAPKAT